ncbi:MAG: DUF4124 domain-containing protein [Halioglobus sp.]
MFQFGIFSNCTYGIRVLAVALFLLPAAGYAQVYQWTDEAGNVHFGDRPPEDAEAKSLNLPKGPSEEETEKAQEHWQGAIDARKAESEGSASDVTQASSSHSNERLPEFACYTPIEDVLRGPTHEAYVPVTPTDVTLEQQRGARSILSSVKGLWYGSAVELICSGQLDAPKSENLFFEVRSTGTWRDKEGLLILENRASGSRNRVNETRVSYIEVGDALYYFDAKGDGNQNVDRTIALRGNKAEGLYLDNNSLAFMSKRRSYHVMRTEIRHLKVKGRTLEFTELYFHKNLLTGSRVWTVNR